ncbi:hypothetical protein ACSTS3_06055 [Aquimarina muelleri]|uniref:hypothetical protein n=1 Tax=Aquimarina muelleri TaxID=279356 RepID=UPI003F688466
MKNRLLIFLPFLLYTMSCKKDNSIAQNLDNNSNSEAKVTSVSVTSIENGYSFSVGIQSPDKGCDQYANWWEVISEDKKLIYRRVLAHSHVHEQPFVRSGGPVKITKEQKVYIRVHMNTTGYSTKMYTGSIAKGFKKSTLDIAFASNLETVEPLPNGCAF